VYQNGATFGCPGEVKVFSPDGSIVYELPAGDTQSGPYGVADGGDLDGDGVSDIVIGNPGALSCAGSSPGNAKAYSGFTGVEILNVDGQPGCTWLGWAVDGIGDMNGDGRDDVAVSATGPDVVDLYSGVDGSLQMRIESPTGGNYGYGVVGLGDLDGDGYVEIGGSGLGAGAWVHSTCPGSSVTYGAGCEGSSDAVPKLVVTGCPNPGKKLVMHVTKGFGGQPAFLAFGTGFGFVPIAGTCNLLVSPVLTVAPIGTLFNFGAGFGYKDVPLTVPTGTSGMLFTVQATTVDPDAPFGFAVSNAVYINVQ
jgi:hypothetical protein